MRWGRVALVVVGTAAVALAVLFAFLPFDARPGLRCDAALVAWAPGGVCRTRARARLLRAIIVAAIAIAGTLFGLVMMERPHHGRPEAAAGDLS